MRFLTRHASLQQVHTDESAAQFPPMPYRSTVLVIACVLFVIAVTIRILNIHFLTGDGALLSVWFVYLYEHGFGGLATIDSDYGVTYLTLLWVTTKFGLGPITSVKLIAYVFDAALAALTYFILKDRGSSVQTSLLLAACALFIPTVILNGAIWGQCDVIYTVFCLASWLAATKNRQVAAWALFGIAMSFKIQAVFLLPFLVLHYYRTNWDGAERHKLLIVNRLSPLAAVLSFFICQSPGLIAGRRLGDMLSSYFVFFSSTSGNMKAIYRGGIANVWQLVGRETGPIIWITTTAVLFTFVLVLLLLLATLMRVKRGSLEEVYLLPVVLMVMIPYFLPYMHERYFFAAEVFAAIFAFITRNRVLAATAVVLQITSFIGYAEVLFQPDPVTLSVTPAMMSVVNAGVLLLLILRLFRITYAQSFSKPIDG